MRAIRISMILLSSLLLIAFLSTVAAEPPENPGENKKLDSDGDQVRDFRDNCPDDYNPDQEDLDGDGIGDLCDNCPDDYNPGQDDWDGDGAGDLCDNCPDDYNPGQYDSDGDGYADACDLCPTRFDPDQVDQDGDGVGDTCDVCPSVPNPMQGVIRLHEPVAHENNTGLFSISPDSNRIVLRKDLYADEQAELFLSDPLHGLKSRLSPPLHDDGDVGSGFAITPDSSKVVFYVDVEEDESFDILLVSLDAVADPVVLNDRPATSSSLRLRPDGETVHYRALDDVYQLEFWHVVPVAGGPSTRIGPQLVYGGGRSYFSDDSLYFLLEDESSYPYNLYSVNTTTLESALISGYEIVGKVDIVEEASRVLYSSNNMEFSGYFLSSELLDDGSKVTIAYSDSWFDFRTGSVPAEDAIRVVYYGSETSGAYSDRVDGGDPRYLVEALEEFEVTPDGQSVVFLAGETLRRIDILGGDPADLFYPAPSGSEFRFSPDGNWIVLAAEGSLYKIPVNGDQVTLIGAGPSDFAISPDSGIVTYMTSDFRELWAISMDGGQPWQVTPDLAEGGELIRWYSYSPDSSYIVYRAYQDLRMEVFRAAIEIDADGDGYPVACDSDPDDPEVW